MKPVQVALAVTTAAGLAACSSDTADAPARPAAPPAPPVVTVTMVDHKFEFDPDIPAGRVVFRITNAGKAPHHLIMFPVPEDLPPIDEQLKGTQRRSVEPFASIYDRAPGDTGTFAVDLVPGRRYAMVCSVQDEDGKPHWRNGMATEFRTPGGPPASDAATSTPSSTP